MYNNRILKSTRLENEIFDDLFDESPHFKEIETEGQQHLPTFDSLIRDVFVAFYSLSAKKRPDVELSDKAKHFNMHIIDELLSDNEFLSVKTMCECKELPAFDAAEEFCEKILEDIPEIMKNTGSKHLKTLDKLESQVEELKEKLWEYINLKQNLPSDTLDTKIKNTSQKLERKQNQIKDINDIITNDSILSEQIIKDLVCKVSKAACGKALETIHILSAWGDSPGTEGKSTLDADILSKVRSNPKLLEISKTLGRYREIVSQKRKNGFSYGLGEKYDITSGNNLTLCLAGELALLASPETQALFFHKFQQKDLKQYRKRNRVTKGRGDIIVCVDESISMKDYINWAHAFALSMLDIAQHEKRKFALVHFSSSHQIKTDIFLPGECTVDDTIQSAEHFFNGGTNFETPLSETLKLIKDGFDNADVLFITDGKCRISEKFSKTFLEEKQAAKFSVTGILLDQTDSCVGESLIPFCDNIYRMSNLTGDEIFLKNIE